jgi:hypothetical protein
LNTCMHKEQLCTAYPDCHVAAAGSRKGAGPQMPPAHVHPTGPDKTRAVQAICSPSMRRNATYHLLALHFAASGLQAQLGLLVASTWHE